MPELEIPAEASTREAKELIEEFVDVGDIVEVRSYEMTGGQRTEVTGEITAYRDPRSEPAYLEIDEQPLGEGSVAFDDIELVVRERSR